MGGLYHYDLDQNFGRCLLSSIPNLGMKKVSSFLESKFGYDKWTLRAENFYPMTSQSIINCWRKELKLWKWKVQGLLVVGSLKSNLVLRMTKTEKVQKKLWAYIPNTVHLHGRGKRYPYPARVLTLYSSCVGLVRSAFLRKGDRNLKRSMRSWAYIPHAFCCGVRASILPMNTRWEINSSQA